MSVTTADGPDVARSVREHLEPRRNEMVDLLRRLVEIETPSDHPPGLQRMGEELSSLFATLGSLDHREDNPERGPSLVVAVEGAAAAERPALALCHYDTVWPLGTLERIPFSVDAQGIARGPGCFDMKAGIVVLYFALLALREAGRQPRRPLRILFNPDEEIGSAGSRPLIERLARESEVVYVLESPLPGGTLKTARKGVGMYRLQVEGRAAHAGVEPQKGISALQELAQQIIALHALNDYAAGTTVNVGVARGGTRRNVVAAAAEAEIDVRVATQAEAERVDAAIRGLRSTLDGAVLRVEGGLNRPPMERSEAVGRLVERARAIAAGMGVTSLGEGSTGGGSDGNFTAALGVPTLDGLGAEGEGAHAAHEHVLVESLPRRAALLAGLLAEM